MSVSFGTNRFGYPDPVRLPETCRAAEAAGFDHLWFPDSQLRNGDVFVNVLTAARSTERAVAGTLLVNPVTRHPSVTAASIAAVDLWAPGRVKLGIGAGDTAVLQIGLRPARVAETERAVRTIRALLAGDAVGLGGTAPSRLQQPRPVPVIVAASGPRTARMAGRCADGAVIRFGTDPALIEWGYEEVCAGAREAVPPSAEARRAGTGLRSAPPRLSPRAGVRQQPPVPEEEDDAAERGGRQEGGQKKPPWPADHRSGMLVHLRPDPMGAKRTTGPPRGRVRESRA